MKPTARQLLEEDPAYDHVEDKTIGKWRWGHVSLLVVKEVATGNFYAARYRVGSDGETNELREGGAEIHRVQPVERTVIEYEKVSEAT